MKAAFLIGRLIFGGFFLYNGINHFRNRQPLSGYAQAKGVPNSDLAVPLSGLALLVGGGSVILGLQPKIGALAIAGFLAGASPVMHDFWSMDDAGQRQNEMIHFSKNIALLGAAIALLAVREPWPASVPMPGASAGERVSQLLRKLPRVA